MASLMKAETTVALLAATMAAAAAFALVQRPTQAPGVRFAPRRALPFKVAHDAGGDIAQRFGEVRATPTSFLIDRQARG